MTGSELEKPVSLNDQLSEAFQLGSVLARIETGQNGIVKTVDKIDGTVTGMSERLGIVEVAMGRMSERQEGFDRRLKGLEAQGPTNGPTMDQFIEVREEVKGTRLTWQKIGALLGGLLVIVGLLTFADQLIPG